MLDGIGFLGIICKVVFILIFFLEVGFLKFKWFGVDLL